MKDAIQNSVPSHNAGKEFLTADDIAAILQTSRSASYKLLSSGSFPVVQIGRLVRVRAVHFYEFLKKQEGGL